MKNKVLLALILVSVCIISACNQGETVSSVSPTVSADDVLMTNPTETVTVTEVLEKKAIPINENYFSDVCFQNLILCQYDSNQDGYLSESECDQVTEIDLECRELRELAAGIEVLDGLEHFPKLQSLGLTSLNKVLIKNHPSLKLLGGTEIEINELIIEDCNQLQQMVFSYSSLHDISIRNCANLRTVHMSRSILEENKGVWEFSNTPQMILMSDGYDRIGKLVMDADARLSYEAFYSEAKEVLKFTEQGNLIWSGCEAEWENIAEVSVIFSEKFPMDCFEEADFSYMNIQLLEKIENVYDEQGRKGWNVCVDLMKDAYSKTAFSLYTEEQPVVEQIVVRPVGATWVEVLEYSPNRGVSFEAELNFEVIYRNGEAEEVIGTLSDEQYWTILPTGEKIKYRSGKEWWDKGSYVNQLGE